jgi:hypothetical protein
VRKMHKVKGQRPSITTKFYVVLLHNFNATCWGISTTSLPQAKLEYQKKLSLKLYFSCWYVCVYVCVCMYVRMYVCMYVCLYVCMYVRRGTQKFPELLKKFI